MVSSMNVKSGDKAVVVKDIFGCFHTGEEFVVMDVNKYLIDMRSAKPNEYKVISVTHNEFNKYFKMLNESSMKNDDKNIKTNDFSNKASINVKKEISENNVEHDSVDEEKFIDGEDEIFHVTLDDVMSILEASEISVETIYDHCTVVTCKLPSGFIIVESSASVSKENYSEDIGVDICMKRIRDKVWQLEAYRLMTNLYDDRCYDEDENYLECEDYIECAACCDKFTCKDSPFYDEN